MNYFDSRQIWSNHRMSLARRCYQLALGLLLLGLALTALSFCAQRRASANAAWRDPVDNTRTAAIAPDLALLSLAGVPDDQVLSLSMEKGELETVRAVLVFSADLNDRQRMNGWLWLAYRYERAGQTGRAAQAYRLAGSGAVLGDDLPSLLATETLLAVGHGLLALHDASSARFFLGQASLLAAHAPHLTAYHRQSLLERLVPAIVQADGTRDDWSALAEAVDSGNPKAGYLPSAQGDGRLGLRDVMATRDAVVAEAQDARRAAAAALLSAISTGDYGDQAEISGSGDAADGAIEATRSALRAALRVEGDAIDQQVARLAGTPEINVAVQETLLRWLLLKRRVAAGGYGGELMPEWGSSREAIDAALAAAWMDWLTLQTVTTGSAAAAPFPHLEANTARWAIMAAYWGLFPHAPVSDLVLAAQARVGVGHLRLTTAGSGTSAAVGWSE